MTNRKSHVPFRLVQKSATVDDLQRSLRVLLHKLASFGAQHKYLNEDGHGPTLSSAEIYVRDSCFWQYTVCADIRGGYLERLGRQGVIFNVFNYYIFENVGSKASIIY